MKKTKQQELLSLFDQAITDVGVETELGQFLTYSKEHVLDKSFKGIELMAFPDRISRIVRKHQMGVPISVTLLMAAVNKRSILSGFGLGFWKI
ncbi:hypothetical protein ACRHK7_06545 [Weissella tructae]|uniref:Uncharacterized protein n=2 Tax=Weissella TaxID=46255 RepID=A0A075TZZ5_9LACO|nr:MULTISPECIES: hypothetical protein [Weissella]AIG65493.1 hypothetical protein WS08_0554 [Weissella tructae]AIM62807.1 hypothetical protein WS74_0555 [Weissella ceti]AIM64142.1 hypothetical protein WS105_0552 [Weissella ceti]ELA07048.1 hypothetical protein WCNC_05692 [Weissella ceti NC36]QVV91866.1 hypothetical protein KHQ32_03035 [Weissella tructae]